MEGFLVLDEIHLVGTAGAPGAEGNDNPEISVMSEKKHGRASEAMPMRDKRARTRKSAEPGK
jgi:hypothetical protein